MVLSCMTIEINRVVKSNLWSGKDFAKKKDMKDIVCLVFKHLSLSDDKSVSIVLVNDIQMHKMNLKFRGKDKPTNVLSFPCDSEFEDEYIGDIVLSFETIEKEAIEQGKSFENHFKHLLVHGTLHILGYDHLEEDERLVMEKIEVDILQKIGVVGIY
jgi:probable rRNA maturation factor